ncbi:MAG: FecR family protein [Treponema sp.]|jgi:hypothetical protein|nr:FecR family protein [Treponema sp.]
MAGSFGSGMAFWREYNRTQTKLNEESVGVIIIKDRTADRKFSDRSAWDRLKQETPIYNGDTIRTADLSRAVIIFRDSTSLDLSENTLIQIFYDGERGARVDYSGGNVDVSSSRSVLISNGGSSMEVQGKANLNKSDDDFVLAVLEGQASMDGAALDSGSVLALNAGGVPSASPTVAMTSFGRSVNVLGSAAPTPVHFSWNAVNFTEDTHVIVEVALDRSFRRMAETRDVHDASAVYIPLKTGSYFWRVYPVRGSGRDPAGPFPSGTMEVVPAVAAVLLSPPAGAQINCFGESHVALSWSAVESAQAYLLEISARADMSGSVVSRRVQGTSVTHRGLESGRWYWRITPILPEWVKGAAFPSEAGVFSITVSGNLEEPVLAYPPQDGRIYAGSGGAHVLSWGFNGNTEHWIVELADNPGMTRPIINQRISSNSCPLPKNLLSGGEKTYYWRITAVNGGASSVSGQRRFTVTPGNAPPPVLAAAAPPPEPETEPETPRITLPGDTDEEPPPEPPPPRRPDPEPEPPERRTLRDLIRVSGGATVTQAFPINGHIFSTAELAGAPSMEFVWKGRSDRYRFALFRINGDIVVPASNVTVSSYTLARPGALAPGEYVWHVYEPDPQGGLWRRYPAIAKRFTIAQPRRER